MALAVALRTSSLQSIVTVTGDVDLATALPLQAFLVAEAETSRRDLVLDLRRLNFLGAAGLSAFVMTATALAVHGRTLSVLCDRPNVRRMFVITGLDERLGLQEAAVPA